MRQALSSTPTADLQGRDQADDVIIVAGYQHHFDEARVAQLLLQIRPRRVVNLQINGQVPSRLDDASLKFVQLALLAIRLGNDRKDSSWVTPTCSA